MGDAGVTEDIKNKNNETKQILKEEAIQSTSTSQQINKRRGKFPQKNFNDLREVLNQKRNVQSEFKSNEPPPDPRYNFLADPSRENENKNERKVQYGSGRFSNKYNTTTYENRNYKGRGGTSERGRGNFRNFQRSRSLDEKNYDWDDKQQNRDSSSESKNSWNSPNSSKNKFNTQQKFNYSYKKYHEEPVGKNFESNARNYNQRKTNFKSNESYENSYDFHPRKYYDNYNQSGYQHYSNNRGGYRPPKPNFKRLNPVNIKVECNTQTGERVCSMENIPFKKNNDKPQNRKFNRQTSNHNKYEQKERGKNQEYRETVGNEETWDDNLDNKGIGLNCASEEVWSEDDNEKNKSVPGNCDNDTNNLQIKNDNKKTERNE